MFKFRRTQKPEELDRKLVQSVSNDTGRLPTVKQFRILPRLLNRRESWILQIGVALLLIAFAGAGAIYARKHLEAVPLRGGTYREALVGAARFINPIFAASDVDKDLSRLIYSGLLKYNGQGELVGDLAREFSLEDGGKTVRFALRDGVLWHDGEKFDADDVKFTIETIQNQAWRSPLWRAFQGLTVEVPDPLTVLVRSGAYLPGLPDLFVVGIVPEHIWRPIDPNEARIAQWNLKPVGTGPFKFSSLTKSPDGVIQFYKLTRNSKYHGGVPYLKEVIAQFMSDFESALSALRAHTVDGVSFVPERLRSRIPASGASRLTFSLPRFTGIFFQDRKSEALKKEAVRRALALALDRQAIAALVPDAKAAFAPFLEEQVGYARTIAFPAPDPERANALLDEALWRKGEDGKRSSGENKLALTLTVSDEPISLSAAQAVKRSWEALGAEVKLEAVARQTFGKEVLQRRDYEAVLFSIVSGADPDPYPFWHSSQIDDPGLNLSSISSRALDLALEDGRVSGDARDRLSAYLRFQTLLLEEVPAIVLYSSPYVYAMSSRVRGVGGKIITVPADRLNDVERWFVRSRLGWK